jgi:hypothetical protein
MCLKLPYVEARLWRDKAHRLISRSVAATKTIDPLLTSAGKLSEVVSVVDGIKKRHGLLIEDALIAAINFVPGWAAHRGVIPRGAGKVFKTDCVAYNRAAKTAYLFECKRQYTFLDGDAKKAVDGRLDEIAKLFPAFATSQGWSVTNESLFILSFYGTAKGNKYPVHDRRTVASLFPPCAMRFVNDFVSYTEASVGRWCSERLDPQADKEVVHPKDRTESRAADIRRQTVDENLFVFIDRDGYSDLDRFLIVPEDIRVVRENEG